MRSLRKDLPALKVSLNGFLSKGFLKGNVKSLHVFVFNRILQTREHGTAFLQNR